MNPLYDYVFLNMEGNYDAPSIKAIADGLRSAKAVSRKALIVRVPAFHDDDAAGRARLREVFALGADGITFPHVQSVDEARRILAAAAAEKLDVWSPATPGGEKLLMMMIEDPGAAAQAKDFADLKGYSILACGIGSLTGALGGNREQAEAENQKILAETKRAKLVNMLTANAQDVEKRVKEGFLALLMQGAQADEAIRIGRAAAGR
jgi:2-keto-3-deoxy-L-rhamnonate aldolase RhmA